MNHHGLYGGGGLPGENETPFTMPFAFGDDGYIPESFLGQPVLNQSVLNQQDKDFLENFWENPNDSAGTGTFFSAILPGQSIDGNAGAMSLSGFDIAPHVDENSAATSYSNPIYAHQVNDAQLQSQVDGPHDQDNQVFHGDVDVAAAASSLFGMAGQRSVAGSMWGNFELHTPQGDDHVHVRDAHDQQHSATLPSTLQQQHQTTPFTDNHSNNRNEFRFTQGQPSGGFQMAPARRVSSEVPAYIDPDRYSHDQHPLERHSYSKQDMRGDHELMSAMQWGSDRNFSALGYRSHPRHVERDQSNFVLPIVTTGGQVLTRSPEPDNHQLYQPRRTSSGHIASSSRYAGQNPSLLSSDSRLDRALTLSGQYNNRKEHEEAPQPDPCQPRKRRRGQADLSDDEHDVEFLPSPPRAKSSNSKRARKLVKSEDSDASAINATPAKPYPGRKTSKSSRTIPDTHAATPFSAGSPPSSAARLSAAEEAAHLNLTEDQKRGNHIKSEQRRRDLIKAQFDDIGTLVPVIKNSKTGFSRSDALFEAVRFIKKLAAGNTIMESRYGVRFEKVLEKNEAEVELE